MTLNSCERVKVRGTVPLCFFNFNPLLPILPVELGRYPPIYLQVA